MGLDSHKKILKKKEKKILSDKTYEQAIGFLRIPNGINPLDNTGIHQESYKITEKLIN